MLASLASKTREWKLRKEEQEQEKQEPSSVQAELQFTQLS